MELRGSIQDLKPLAKQLSEARSARGKVQHKLDSAEARLLAGREAREAADAVIAKEEVLVAQHQDSLQRAIGKVEEIEVELRRVSVTTVWRTGGQVTSH